MWLPAVSAVLFTSAGSGFVLFCFPLLFCLVQFGDVHPGRSCRLRKPGDDYEYTKSLTRTSGSGGGGGFGGSGRSGSEDGGQEGWSLFGWGDEEEYDASDDGPWATKGRVWRDEDDDNARFDL